MFTNNNNASPAIINRSTKNSSTNPQAQRNGLKEKLAAITLAATLAATTFVASAVRAQDRAERTRAAATGLRMEGEMREVRWQDQFNANPVAPLLSQAGSSSRQAGRTSLEAAPNVYGTFSVQSFPNPKNNLGNTHASAQGFRDFLSPWYAPNFILQDGNVKPEYFFDSTSSFGFPLSFDGAALDSALAVWHSSHGNMSNNVYTTNLGASGLNGYSLWPSYGDTISSDVMALGGTTNGFGNQTLRYMFWDTCYGVRFNGGNNPYSTWAPRAKGIRMIFGYDTTSVDDANYGKYFWEEWSKGKTLAQSFLDASWRISNHQTPVAMAFGATTAEAGNLRNTERTLNWGAVSANAASWSWYNAQPAVSKQQPAAMAVFEKAAQAGVYTIEAQDNGIEAVSNLAGKFGINVEQEGMVQNRPFGLKAVRTNGANLIVEANGNYEMTFKQSVQRGVAGAAVENDTLFARASNVVNELGLSANQQIEASFIRTLNEASSSQGNEPSQARVIEKTVIFDQVVGELRFNDPEAGHIEVSFDAQTGQVTRLRSTLKKLAMAQQSEGTVTTHSVETARAAALGKVKSAAQIENTDTRFEIVAGSESIGYSMVNGKATPVYRVQISNSQSPNSRPQQVIIPLTGSDKARIN